MKKIKTTGFFEKVFYNNKFLFVLSVILSVALWAAVKINYSDSTTRTISDVRFSIDSRLAQENDFEPFVDSEALKVDVEISGKSFNVNSFSKDSIVVEAVSGYVDSAGYKVLNITARSNESGVTIASVTPSTITVFFDKAASDTFNVEAKIKNIDALKNTDDYYIGQPIPSLSTVSVSGPASVLEGLKKVSFTASVNKDLLPLTETVEIPAKISFATTGKAGKEFLTCNDVGTESNPASITIPVSKIKTVKTAVKFINEPTIYDKDPPRVTIEPANVKILYNPSDEEYESYNVSTVDFSRLKDGKNVFTVSVDEKNTVALFDKDIKQFKVTIDLGTMSQTVLDASNAKVVFLNQSKGYKYTASLADTGLDSVTIIGPESSLEKLKADMLQIEINVSSLDTENLRYQSVEISNISIQSPDINDCWVYGSYRAKVSVKPS